LLFVAFETFVPHVGFDLPPWIFFPTKAVGTNLPLQSMFELSHDVAATQSALHKHVAKNIVVLCKQCSLYAKYVQSWHVVVQQCIDTNIVFVCIDTLAVVLFVPMPIVFFS
jgi:hypothetical protein